MDNSKILSFFALAEELNFSKASARLYKSQPVLSRQISQLEEDLGVTLFYRDSKNVELTPAGKHFLMGMKEISGRYSTLLAETLAIQNGYAGQINIGVLSGQLLSPRNAELLSTFSTKHPGIHVSMTALGFEDLEQGLKNHTLDFVFCAAHGLLATKDFSSCVTGKARTVMLVPKTHPLAGGTMSGLTVDDFQNDTFLLFEEFESRTGVPLTKQFFSNRRFFPKILEAPSIDTLNLWLETGIGVALQNEYSILCCNPNVRVLYLEEPRPVEESIIWSRSSSKACDDVFIEHMDAFFGDVGKDK